MNLQSMKFLWTKPMCKLGSIMIYQDVPELRFSNYGMGILGWLYIDAFYVVSNTLYGYHWHGGEININCWLLLSWLKELLQSTPHPPLRRFLEATLQAHLRDFFAETCFQVSSIAVFVGLSHTYVICCINVIREKISHRLIDIMYFNDKILYSRFVCGRKLSQISHF